MDVPVTIATLALKPGDTLVLHHPARLSYFANAALRQSIEPHIPTGVKLLVLEEGMSLARIITDPDTEREVAIAAEREANIAAARSACPIIHKQIGIGSDRLADHIEASIRARKETS